MKVWSMPIMGEKLLAPVCPATQSWCSNRLHWVLKMSLLMPYLQTQGLAWQFHSDSSEAQSRNCWGCCIISPHGGYMIGYIFVIGDLSEVGKDTTWSL